MTRPRSSYQLIVETFAAVRATCWSDTQLHILDVTLEQLADAFQDNHDRFYRDWFLTRSRYRQDRFHSTLHLPEDS